MSDIHRLTGAYAIDALDDLERARFEQHLEVCEDCRTEVASLRETAAMLSETTALAPPPALRESVLAGISQVRPLPPLVPPAPVRVTGRRWFPFLVAAVVVGLLSVGAAVWQPWAEQDRTRLSAAEQVLRAPDAQEVTVDLGPAGRATVVRSVSQARAVLVTEDMAPAPAGKVYEVWLQDDSGSMVPAGLMPRGPDQQMVLEGDAAAATAAGITVEPAGGSPAPTSEPIVLFDFSEAA